MNDFYIVNYRPAEPGDAPTADEIRELQRSGTDADCRIAGMGLWDEESGLRLIPAAWIAALPDDLEVQSIMGEIDTIGRLRAQGGGWDDTRMNMLAFGWIPRPQGAS